METDRMNTLVRIAFATVLISAAAGSVLAQSQQEQAACRSDAMKHCSSVVGKQDEMRKCLATNKAKLSEACQKVVTARGG